MISSSPNVEALNTKITNEVIRAMNLSRDGLASRFIRPMLRKATVHFSELFAQTDEIVGGEGFPQGAGWLLKNLVKDFDVCGAENIPHEGPLIIASNHPGATDSVLITTSVARPDFKIIAEDVPFLKNLPHISAHSIFTSMTDPYDRMRATREGIRHLKNGGSLLLFARANIDPEPAFMPEAEEELSLWTRGLEIFLKTVPQAHVIVAIVSHVLDRRYMKHPLVYLRRTRIDRQRLAMMMQIIQQMFGKRLDLVPRVSFGEAISLPTIASTDHALDAIVASAKCLMRQHLARPRRAGQV